MMFQSHKYRALQLGYTGTLVLFVCFAIQACSGKSSQNLGGLQKSYIDTSNFEQSRFAALDRSTAIGHTYQYTSCNSAKELSKPLRVLGEGIEHGERIRFLHTKGVTEHHRYLDCLLWFGGSNAGELTYAQRLCSSKTFCSVKISSNEVCKKELKETVSTLKGKNIGIAYDGFAAAGEEGYIKKLCGHLYPDWQAKSIRTSSGPPSR